MSATYATPTTYGRDSAWPKWSVERYQRMIEAGILTSDDRVELLENYVVLKMPRNPRDDGTIDLVNSVLPGCLPAGWFARIQQTVVLPDSQLEPDFAVVKGNRRSFLTRHPGADDVGLLIEVADASLLRDQRDKTRIYARAGIAIYWIVNLVDRRVEVFSGPTGSAEAPAYLSFHSYQPGDDLPLVLDGQVSATIAVNDILP